MLDEGGMTPSRIFCIPDPTSWGLYDPEPGSRTGHNLRVTRPDLRGRIVVNNRRSCRVARRK